MIEILVSLRRHRETGEVGSRNTEQKQAGDVLVAKKSPAVWGAEEYKNFLIAYLDDPKLEKRVEESGGLMIHPYAEPISLAEFETGKHKTKSRSTKKVNLDLFDLDKKEKQHTKNGKPLTANQLIGG